MDTVQAAGSPLNCKQVREGDNIYYDCSKPASAPGIEETVLLIALAVSMVIIGIFFQFKNLKKK